MKRWSFVDELVKDAAQGPHVTLVADLKNKEIDMNSLFELLEIILRIKNINK